LTLKFRARTTPPRGLCLITRPTFRERLRVILPTRHFLALIRVLAVASFTPITFGTRQRRVSGAGGGGGGAGGGGGGGGAGGGGGGGGGGGSCTHGGIESVDAVQLMVPVLQDGKPGENSENVPDPLRSTSTPFRDVFPEKPKLWFTIGSGVVKLTWNQVNVQLFAGTLYATNDVTPEKFGVTVMQKLPPAA
jgi:hypothetical protein